MCRRRVLTTARELWFRTDILYILTYAHHIVVYTRGIVKVITLTMHLSSWIY